eukprot:6263210-Ditylum_brightwellii.AAC.1
MAIGSRPASTSHSSPSSGFVIPTKSSVASPANSTGTTVSANSCKGEGGKLIDDNEELEKAITIDTVLHETVLYGSTPPSPNSTMSEAHKKEVREICDLKKNLKNK